MSRTPMPPDVERRDAHVGMNVKGSVKRRMVAAAEANNQTVSAWLESLVLSALKMYDAGEKREKGE